MAIAPAYTRYMNGLDVTMPEKKSKSKEFEMKTRWIRLPFLIPTWAAAQVIFPRTVFYRGTLTKEIAAHEIAHIKQIEKYGLFTYWTTYIREALKQGYRRNALETDANARAKDYNAAANVVIWNITQGGNKRWTNVLP